MSFWCPLDIGISRKSHKHWVYLSKLFIVGNVCSIWFLELFWSPPNLVDNRFSFHQLSTELYWKRRIRRLRCVQCPIYLAFSDIVTSLLTCIQINPISPKDTLFIWNTSLNFFKYYSFIITSCSYNVTNFLKKVSMKIHKCIHRLTKQYMHGSLTVE